MKNSAELLYQIRGLARSVVAFVFFYQGVIPKLLLQMRVSSEPSQSYYTWQLYLGGLMDIGLAVWLILAFTDKKPLWASSGFLVLSLIGAIIFSPNDLGTTFNIVTLTIALLALMLTDLKILHFQKIQTQQRKVGQYIRVTRDRMLYEFIKRLELKDIPHLMHTLAQSRVKRHLKNRRQLKRRTEFTETADLPRSRSSSPIKERSVDDRRKILDEFSDESE
jgi:hypothetical protein